MQFHLKVIVRRRFLTRNRSAIVEAILINEPSNFINWTGRIDKRISFAGYNNHISSERVHRTGEISLVNSADAWDKIVSVNLYKGNEKQKGKWQRTRNKLREQARGRSRAKENPKLTWTRVSKRRGNGREKKIESIVVVYLELGAYQGLSMTFQAPSRACRGPRGARKRSTRVNAIPFSFNDTTTTDITEFNCRCSRDRLTAMHGPDRTRCVVARKYSVQLRLEVCSRNCQFRWWNHGSSNLSSPRRQLENWLCIK